MVISLDGWRIGQRDLPSPCLFRTVSTKFHLDRRRQFLYEFSVKKLVFWDFRGYLGEIESGKKRLEFFESGKKRLETFIYVFFARWCVRVSASNFCTPTCSGSRDTTLGSFLRFMARPARRFSKFRRLVGLSFFSAAQNWRHHRISPCFTPSPHVRIMPPPKGNLFTAHRYRLGRYSDMRKISYSNLLLIGLVCVTRHGISCLHHVRHLTL